MSTNPELAEAIALVLGAAAQTPRAQPPQTPTLLTVEEATEKLRCSRTLVYAMLKDGRLASVRVGRRRLVKDADLECFIARGGAGGA